MFDKLSSTKPFMFNAYYEWMIKNEITPHLLVDASVKGVKVPLDFVKDDCIILSLKPTAISEFQCLERGISFKARFKGVSEDIYIPYKAMEELIAIETNCSLPIGKALDQLELSPQADEEIYPDEGTVAEDPLFKVEKDPVAIEGAPAEDIKPSKDETKSQSEPGFEFVKD
ncbi:MAG: ClpXP protease specificity-enhancing factor SspB [Succinivibrio sp.]|nr:ClpXP protease specificity-enhancing factor SspB [Succinivibrio sp.]